MTIRHTAVSIPQPTIRTLETHTRRSCASVQQYHHRSSNNHVHGAVVRPYQGVLTPDMSTTGVIYCKRRTGRPNGPTWSLLATEIVRVGPPKWRPYYFYDRIIPFPRGSFLNATLQRTGSRMSKHLSSPYFLTDSVGGTSDFSKL